MKEIHFTEIAYKEFRDIIEGERSIYENIIKRDSLNGSRYRGQLRRCDMILGETEPAPDDFIYLREEREDNQPGILRFMKKKGLREVLGPIEQLR